MYNRYIRSDNGTYTRIPEEEPRPQQPRQPQGPPSPGPGGGQAQQPHPQQPPHGPGPESRGPRSGQEEGRRPFGPPPPLGGKLTDGLTGFLQHILDQLHLDHVDTGDLLLLVLLFFLFREDADEELLVALGLLLIL